MFLLFPWFKVKIPKIQQQLEYRKGTTSQNEQVWLGFLTLLSFPTLSPENHKLAKQDLRTGSTDGSWWQWYSCSLGGSFAAGSGAEQPSRDGFFTPRAWGLLLPDFLHLCGSSAQGNNQNQRERSSLLVHWVLFHCWIDKEKRNKTPVFPLFLLISKLPFGCPCLLQSSWEINTKPLDWKRSPWSKALP